jgi:CheY-like chemotaxis protein
MNGASHRLTEVPWVLVVDDEPLASRATARLVSRATEGSVAVARDLATALHLVRRARTAPSAVLLDFELGAGQDGTAVLTALREAGCRAPCAFHTAAPERARQALQGLWRGEQPPVFEKDGRGGRAIAWLTAALGGGTRASGVRPRAR